MTGVDAPDADMCIGISTETAPTANSLVTISDASDTDYHTSFFADKAMKEDVIYDSSTNKLMLAVPQITVTQTGTNPPTVRR